MSLNKKKSTQSNNSTPNRNENRPINRKFVVNNSNTNVSSNLKMNLNNLINISGTGMNNRIIGNNMGKQFSNDNY
jgi:hypothetical protein